MITRAVLRRIATRSARTGWVAPCLLAMMCLLSPPLMAATYTIEGNAGVAGATVTASSNLGTLTTTASSTGAYKFTGIPRTHATITPSKANYTFEPRSLSGPVPPSYTGVNFTAIYDASIVLGKRWGGSGPKYQTWVKSVLLLAANTGAGFKGVPNVVTGTHTKTLIAVLRDRSKKVGYIGWYDPQRAEAKHPLAMGLMPATGMFMQVRDRTTGAWVTKPVNSQADADNALAWISAQGGFGSSQIISSGIEIRSQEGCFRDAFVCSTTARHGNADGSWDSLQVMVGWPYDGSVGVTGNWSHQKAPSATFAVIHKFIMSILLTIAGGPIGEIVGITSTVANTTFAATFGAFSSAIVREGLIKSRAC
jgi:hypothetical protein